MDFVIRSCKRTEREREGEERSSERERGGKEMERESRRIEQGNPKRIRRQHYLIFRSGRSESRRLKKKCILAQTKEGTRMHIWRRKKDSVGWARIGKQR